MTQENPRALFDTGWGKHSQEPNVGGYSISREGATAYSYWALDEINYVIGVFKAEKLATASSKVAGEMEAGIIALESIKEVHRATVLKFGATAFEIRDSASWAVGTLQNVTNAFIRRVEIAETA